MLEGSWFEYQDEILQTSVYVFVRSQYLICTYNNGAYFSISSAQRSAQELPLVEKQSADSYHVMGGKKMILNGHNFLQDSKVIFVEKAPGI